MGGSSAPAVPPMSKQEKDLMTQQTDLLKQQQIMTQHSFDTQNLLAPFLYKQLGLTPTMDDKGNITGFTQAPIDTAISDQQKTITQELLDRQQQALEGTIPLDHGLTRQMDETEAQLHASLLQSLGPGYETSTSGATALDRFQQTKLSTYDAARRGDLTLAEQLALSMQGGQNANSGFLTQTSGGIAGTGANYGQLFGQAAAGYNNPLSVLENTRNQQFQANAMGVQSQQALWSGLGSGLGNLAGMAIGKGLPSGFLANIF